MFLPILFFNVKMLNTYWNFIMSTCILSKEFAFLFLLIAKLAK